MLIFRISLTQNEGVMKEDNLSIDIFHNNEEGLCSAVDLIVPAEIGQVIRRRERVMGWTWGL
jgi:hypothetical protein